MNENRMPAEPSSTVEQIWKEQLRSHDEGNLIPAEALFQKFPELLDCPESAVDVIFNEFELRRRSSNSVVEESEFLRRFPEFKQLLERQFRLLSAFEGSESFSEESTANMNERWQSLHHPHANLVSERFKNRQTVGQGATATVESAFDQVLQQKVAIKRLHPHLSESARANRRLQLEAQTTARLHHPHIVPLHEILEDQGQLLLVTRLVEGQNLDLLISQSNRPEIDTLVKWTCQIADALHYSHENGVTHRDVKPANIIVDESGNALLTDFGLASFSDSQGAITQTGELVGTPAFMSPEQVAAGTQDVDFRTDIYSLGATLYFLLAGRPPFEGSFSSVIKQVAEQNPTPIRSDREGIAQDLFTIVNKCLMKAPEERYSTARELGDDLRRFQRGELILAKQAGLIERCFKYCRRHPFAFTGIATLLLLSAFLSGTLLQLGQVRGQRNRAQLAEKENRKLLATASADAGRLALQRGNPNLAIGHFLNSLEQDVENPCDVYFDLVDCNLTIGKVESAAKYLELARLMIPQLHSGHEEKSALIGYWQSELSAAGYSGYLDSAIVFDRSKLDDAKQHFLSGIDAADSVEACEHFRNAVESDPYHHSARRMYLIMALSLARFDEVQTGTELARQLYPEDIDFRLIGALASACNGDVNSGKNAVSNTSLTNGEKKEWIEFCDFLSRMKSPLILRDSIEKEHLSMIVELLAEFEEQYLPLLESRQWRFPKKIGEKFSRLRSSGVLGNGASSNLLAIAKDLAEIHPEATLLAIVSENELAGANPLEQLEYSRDCFLRAAQAPTFVHISNEASWVGLFSTAMALEAIHKQDSDKNRQYMVLAAEHLNPEWLLRASHTRAFTISLIKIGEWGLAKPFIERWIELAESAKQSSEAQWHLALWYKHNQNWSQVVDICDEVQRLAVPGAKPSKSWRGLRNHAINEMQKRIEE